MSEEVRERLEAAKLSDDPVAPPAPFDEVDAIIQTYVDTAAVPGDEDRVNRSREAMIRTIVTTFVDEQGLRGKDLVAQTVRVARSGRGGGEGSTRCDSRGK